MNVRRLIGSRMKDLRKQKGMSQEDLSEKAATSANYVSRMERGTENPTLDMFVKIAESLEVDLLDLFDFKHEENARQLKETLKRFAGEIDDEKKLKTAVRVLRAIAR